VLSEFHRGARVQIPVHAGERALDDGAGAQVQRRQPRQIIGVE
jgi:hypothetical protein